MSEPFATLRNRVLAIVCDARGADGTLGAEATARAIPAGRFRRAVVGAPLRDANYPREAIDRAVRVDWIDDADFAEANNPRNVPQQFDARIAVTNAVVYGPGLSAFASLVGSEVAATTVTEAQERALADARRIRNALHEPDLIRDSSDSEPIVIACTREGASTPEDLGDGRMLAVSVYVLRYQSANTSTDDP